MKCRFCGSKELNVFLDLLNSPPSNSFLTKKQLNEPETFFPLKVFTCKKCKLVQINEYKKSNDIFDSNYAYFSSYSVSWLAHAEKYVNMIVKKLSLDKNSLVTEIASNDGYLLQYFQEKKIPCIGIEPTQSTAKAAKNKNIKVIEDFFNKKLAIKIKKSDLIIGNNVLAHVPNINDFVEGLKLALKKNGTITMEFPYLINLIDENQFDTIYHEHFSYFSFYTVCNMFQHHNLKIYDVEQLKTHGGSLRIYATHKENARTVVNSKVKFLLQKEKKQGVLGNELYKGFQKEVDNIKCSFLNFLLNAKKENKKVIAYGAAAKGNTLLNYCGIKNDMINFIVDKSPHKQGKYLPGSHIKIANEEKIKKAQPDYIIIFPWNIKEEIINQLSYVKKWECKFVVLIPKLAII